MPTTFKVIFLGNHASIDISEGNNISENATVLEDTTFGSTGDPLYSHVQTLSQGTNGFAGGSNADAYNTDNNSATDQFRINDGADQTIDGTAAYTATITYADGNSETISAVVFQDTLGNTYLAPELLTNNDKAHMEAGPITSLRLDSLITGDASLTANRLMTSFVEPDGTIDGSASNDTISSGTIDANGDAIGGFDGDNDIIDAGGGADSINAGAGSDLIYGGSGDESIDAGAGIDIVYGGLDNDIIEGGDSTDTLYGGDGADSLSDSGGSLSDDFIYGGAGDDTIAAGVREDTIYGGDDSDRIIIDDGFGADVIYGGDGGTDSDTLDLSALGSGVGITYTGNEQSTFTDGTVANTGTSFGIENVILTGQDDTLNATNDAVGISVNSGAGADSITGGDGADTISGEVGADTINSGLGDDIVYGGTGADSIDAGSNNDRLYGGDGDDTLDGGVGTDSVFGGAGNDLVQGGGNTGNPDLVYGGAGNDSVVGGNGAGQDTLYGDAGNDTLDGQRGADTVYGGDGSDTFQLNDTFGSDTIYGGEGGTDLDTLDLNALGSGVTVTSTGDERGTFNDGADSGAFFGIESYELTDQSDQVNASNDTVGISVDGHAGDDSIAGGSGNDIIYGGDGSDTLRTGLGEDVLYGGAGDDLLTNSAGNDTLVGGTGNDTLIATLGDDHLYGGAGNDSLDGARMTTVSMVVLVGKP